MPAATAIIALVSTAASTAYTAYVANDNAIDAKHAAGRQADRENAAATEEANAIREKARRLKGQQVAELAAAGVKLDGSGGSADTILEETDRLSEQDAMAALREGRERAAIVRDQGNLTAGNYRSRAVAESLNGVSSMIGQVNSYRSATAGTRFANQIDQDSASQSFARRNAPRYSLLGSGTGQQRGLN